VFARRATITRRGRRPSTALIPSTTSAGLAWRTGCDDNGLLTALQPLDLLFELGVPQTLGT
jgi:hypothetical protein